MVDTHEPKEADSVTPYLYRKVLLALLVVFFLLYETKLLTRGCERVSLTCHAAMLG